MSALEVDQTSSRTPNPAEAGRSTSTSSAPSIDKLDENQGAPIEPTTTARTAELARAKTKEEAFLEEQETAASKFNPGWRFHMIFVTICIITLAAALDATSLSVALPIIANALGGTAIEAFWSGTSFLLTSTVFQPAFASMSHIFGRKPAMYVAIAFFAVGAILAAVAHNFTLLLVGRSLQGIGGGGIISLSEIIVTDLVPLRFRGTWFGYLSSMWAIGSVTGPIVGGAFAQDVSWRWIFWINIPIIGFGLLFVTIFLKLNFIVGSFGDKLRRFDWIGAVLFIASTTAILIPISWGGVMYSWSSWHTLVPLILGFAGEVAFVCYEYFVAVEPMMPFTIFANRDLRITYSTTVIHGVVLWSILYYMPLYYEAVRGYSPIITGVALFPETFTVAPASIAVGITVTLTGRYRWALWSGWAFTIAGCGLLVLMTPTISVPGWIFLNLVPGLGLGLLFPSMAFSIQAAVAVPDIAFGVAFFSFFRAFGQGIGVAVSGVIFQNQIRQKMLTYELLAPFADKYAKDATSLVQIINGMSEGLEKTQLKQAYADSIQTIWIVMCALSAVAGIASLFIKGYSLDQVLITGQGFAGEKKTEDAERQEGAVVQ